MNTCFALMSFCYLSYPARVAVVVNQNLLFEGSAAVRGLCYCLLEPQVHAIEATKGKEIGLDMPICHASGPTTASVYKT